MSHQAKEQRPEPATPAPVMAQQDFAAADALALYGRMRPDQRTAIANEFLRLFTLAGNDEARQLIGDPAAKGGMDSPQQVAALHTYARDHAPDVLAAVWRHPVTQAALAAPGAASVREVVDEREQKRVAEALMPTENVAVTGQGYVSSGMMMYLGGEKSAQYVEAPHEMAVSAGTDATDEEAVRREEEEDASGGA